MSELDESDRYKLLVSVVIPRPIALVTTCNAEGGNNAAPFSFFNLMGHDPPIVVLGIEGRSLASRNRGDVKDGHGLKDTVRNIKESGEFVVNLVDEPLLARMNVCAIDFPSEVDELQEAGLNPVSSRRVVPPRIGESPVQLECCEIINIGVGRKNRTIVLGEVVHLHIRDDAINPTNLHVNVDLLRIVGRLHGGGWYLKTTEMLQLPRLSYADWEARKRNPIDPA